MEHCSGVEKCDFSFEIVDCRVVWVEEVCGAELETWSWTFEELLAEIEGFLLNVYPHNSVRASCVSAVKDKLSNIRAHYQLTEGQLCKALQQPKSTTIC